MGPSLVRTVLALSLAGAPPEAAPPALQVPATPGRAVPEAPPEATQGVSVQPPLGTWIAAGVAAGLFATGLGFTLTATSIEHQAGTLNANGVDTGLTRARAVQGLNDVRIGNTLLVGAGVALIIAVTLAVLQARSAGEPAASPPAEHPLALGWALP